ncbi:MAG: hypothetical protein KGQ37_12990 [Hyphomicrobiales bacterium]|nr:hypothetical protein [Hyphomicrobiales bacterium]
MRMYQAYPSLPWGQRPGNDIRSDLTGRDLPPSTNDHRSPDAHDIGQPAPACARPVREGIIIIDDEDLSRDSLALFLARQGFGSGIMAFARLEGVSDLDSTSCALVLLNVSGHAGGCAGRVALLEAVSLRFAGVPVLVIADQDDQGECHKVFAAGASGFFPTSGDASHLLAAVRLLLAGEQFIPARILGELIRGNAVAAKPLPQARATAALLS